MTSAELFEMSTCTPRSLRRSARSRRSAWSRAVKRLAVYEVKLDVSVSGAYGGSKYTKSPAIGSDSTVRKSAWDKSTDPSALEQARRFSSSQMPGFLYLPNGTLNLFLL